MVTRCYKTGMKCTITKCTPYCVVCCHESYVAYKAFIESMIQGAVN